MYPNKLSYINNLYIYNTYRLHVHLITNYTINKYITTHIYIYICICARYQVSHHRSYHNSIKFNEHQLSSMIVTPCLMAFRFSGYFLWNIVRIRARTIFVESAGSNIEPAPLFLWQSYHCAWLLTVFIDVYF